MKRIFRVAAVGLLISMVACQIPSGSAQGTSSTVFSEITADEFEKKITPDVQLIDVRTPEEFSQGHLRGAINLNINSADFKNQVSGLDKNKPVLVYCLSGGRSASASAFLVDNGFNEVYNLRGGIMKWDAAGKALETGVASSSSGGLTSDDFKKILQTEKYVLVDYQAKWCVPCKKMAPMLESFAETRKDKLELLKIDADINKEFLKLKGIESIPVLELYKNGKLIWSHEGELDEATLISETKL